MMYLLRKRSQRTLSRFAENEKRKRSKKIAYFCTFIGYIIFAVLFFYLLDLTTAVILSALLLFLVIPVDLFGWYLTNREQEQRLSRYIAFCTNKQYPTVLVVTSKILPKTQQPQPHQCAMIFYGQDEEKVRRFAKCLIRSQKKQLPQDEMLRLQAEIENSEKILMQTTFTGFALVDLYDLKNKTILIARNVIEYYGEPDSARLAQKGCTLSILDDSAEETQIIA